MKVDYEWDCNPYVESEKKEMSLYIKCDESSVLANKNVNIAYWDNIVLKECC